MPKIDKTYDALVALKADTNFVKANKNDYEAALSRLGSISKIRSSLKTIKFDNSYSTMHKKGSLPEFYLENKLKLQKEKEDELRRQEEERIYNENK